jgi:hypothetical protein
MALHGTHWQATSSRGKTLVSSCCSSFPLTSCAQQDSMEDGRENPFLEESLQWIGALVRNQGKNINQLCYVDLIINGRTIHALVDFSASHNFLKKELASELRLRVGLCGASVKVVNSKAKETIGVASTVHI